MLGMHLNAVRRLLPDNYSPKPYSGSVYGLTDASAPLRAFLADILYDMSMSGLSRKQIAEITGLNRNESFKAEKRPFNHDYKISQIERILHWNDNFRKTHQ